MYPRLLRVGQLAKTDHLFQTPAKTRIPPAISQNAERGTLSSEEGPEAGARRDRGSHGEP
jgi:hypothetical protein